MYPRALIAAALFMLSSQTVQAIWVPRDTEEVDVERILRSMTIEEKVGQLLVVGFGGTTLDRHSQHWVAGRHVGGVALFSRNITDFEQTARFARELHAATEGHIPLFLALDQEGGNVVRVKEGAMLLPGNMALGATRSPTLAYVAGQALAIDLKRLGFNMNLAPVLDVNSNPQNPVIGIRSYGERAELVAELGSWYVRGQQEMGVVAVAKHFPGHGDTQTDSHYAMPSISASLERLEGLEFLPFERSIKAGLDAVMTAHISLPAVTGDRDLPATLSRVLLTDALRNKMNFKGIVITDGLEMQGIVQKYGSGRAAVLAILAGADMPMILWTPKVKEQVYAELLEAVDSGTISSERLDQSVRRILTIKAKRGLFSRKLANLETVLHNRNQNPIHDQVAKRIARESITLVRNHGDVLPLRGVRYRKIVVIAPGEFGKRLAQEPNTQVITIPYVPSRERRKKMPSLPSTWQRMPTCCSQLSLTVITLGSCVR
ncbi:MAG: beta-N-acetylhexosaminidase [Myxococcota bacterium]